MPSVLKYIASLPSRMQPARHKVWPSDHYRTADTTFVGRMPNNTPYCQTIMYYTLEKGYRYTPESHAHNQVLQNIISTQLLNVLRVEHSDVYAPSCILTDGLLPVSRMKFNIMFTCDPTQRERIAKDVDRLMHDMAHGDLITQELIDSYIKQRERDKQPDGEKRREQEIDALINRELYGFAMDESDLSYIRSVTPASLKAHLRRLLKKGNLHIGYLTTE